MPEYIKPEDLKIELWPPKPLGGQQVGNPYNGVMVTHIPTDTMVRVCANRSQHKNIEIAKDMILAGLTHKDFR